MKLSLVKCTAAFNYLTETTGSLCSTGVDSNAERGWELEWTHLEIWGGKNIPRGEEDIRLPRGTNLRKGTGLGEPSAAVHRRWCHREVRCFILSANTRWTSRHVWLFNTENSPSHRRAETSGEKQHFDKRVR